MVIGVPVRVVGLLQLTVGVDLAVLIGVGIGAVAEDPHQLLAVDLLRDARAEVALQVLADGDAAGGGRRLEGGHVVLILDLDPGGVSKALGLGGLQGGLDDAHVLQGLVQEVVVPGHAGGGLLTLGGLGNLNAQHGGGVGAELLTLQGSAGVQAQVAGEVGILVQEVAVGRLVVVAHLGSGVLLPVNGGGGGHFGEEVAAPDKGDDQRDQDGGGDDAVEQIGPLLLLALLRLPGGLGVGLTGGGLTVLLFS